jgi:hypothetical protein
MYFTGSWPCLLPIANCLLLSDLPGAIEPTKCSGSNDAPYRSCLLSVAHCLLLIAIAYWKGFPSFIISF